MSQGAGDVLVLDHVFPASRDRVWSALTEPELLPRWFGPEGWTVDPESVEINLRVGGLQRFSMHDATFPSVVSSVTARFVDVVPGSRLVTTETVYGSGGTDSMAIALTLDLSDTPTGTHLRLEQGPFPEGVDDLARTGWISSFARMERLLSEG